MQKLLSTPSGARLTNTPLVAWGLRTITRQTVRPALGTVIAQQDPGERLVHGDLQSTLDAIVYDVVETLGYVMAMVALYEQGDILTIRAFYIDPRIATAEQIRAWEMQVSQFTPTPVSLANPVVARTYVYGNGYQDNLSVQAVRSGNTLISNDLYSLFTPIVPPAAWPIVRGIQEALAVHQVVAMPFALETAADGGTEREIVGNLFVAKRGVISSGDVQVLSAFGRQAAAAILSERRRLQIKIAQELVFKIQTSLQDEELLLQHIVKGVVSDLGYLASMVATYEQDGSLFLRTYYCDAQFVSPEQIRQWEMQISQFTLTPVSLTDPSVARTYVNHANYQDNLSVRAARLGRPVVSDDLYSLFTPIAPLASRPVVQGVQEALGIQQVIAVPFFLEASADGQRSAELVGNLFAVTRSRRFSSGEIELLQIFAQQAAAGLRNARLYRQSEDRRISAQIFSKMAFSASASVHALRNHIGALRLPLQLLNLAIRNPQSFPEEKRQELLGKFDKGSDIFRHLDEAADILDHLHEPWRQVSDELTDVNVCLRQAINKIIPEPVDWLHVSLAADLPEIRTTRDMLTEAFKVLIRNALEAIEETGEPPYLQISSSLRSDAAIEIIVRDNGVGIKPEHLSKIFEMQWTTKHNGLGFGLFWTKDYIEGFGGCIEVESVWKQSTTFRIIIPVTS